jgi:hypothetical protein
VKPGTYRLQRVLGGFLRFAEVEVFAERVADHPFGAVSSEHHPEARAAIIGIEYGLSHLWSARSEPSIRLTLVRAVGLPSDTTVLDLVFAGYQATCLALELEPDPRVRLEADGFFFPHGPGKPKP